MKKNALKTTKGITLLALIVTIIVLVILAGVSINTLYGENGIISNAEDAERLSNIKSLEEGINLYKIDKNLEGKVQEESYPIALNEDGSKITLSQMKSASELEKLPDGVKYTLLNLTAEKGTTNIPTFEQIDYSQFYKLDYTKLNMSEEEAENLVIYIEGDNYKVINLAGIKYKKNDIYVIIPLNNESEPEYITVANNTYKLYGDGTLKVLGEKTTNSGYTSSEVNTINNSWDEFDLKAINARFDNRMSLPEILTSDWYASHVYFSTGTAYVIDKNNDLWAWGANDYNKLGLGHSFLVVEPTKILEGRCEGKENVKASKVWAGNYNTFVVDTDGILWACGNNSYGVLGQGNYSGYYNWQKIDGINGKDVKEIQLPDYSEVSTALIIMKNGSVYGLGANSGELGDGGSQEKILLINEYYNAKILKLGSSIAWFVKSDGNLYGCGWKGLFGTDKNVTVKNAIRVDDNVKQAQEYTNRVLYITNENKLYLRTYLGEIIEINGITINDNTVLLGKSSLITNGEYYFINSENGRYTKMQELKNVKPYYNSYGDGEILQNKYMNVCYCEEKIFIKNAPNVTKIAEKSNYELRKVFENAIFIQGNENSISIVDKERKVYESVTENANSKINNAKKIVTSNYSKYVVQNDGKLLAKGGKYTGMWGKLSERTEYEEITKDGKTVFDNVKDVYTVNKGKSCIFLTKDDKLYWAGSEYDILLPAIRGDVEDTFYGRITNYPKEVKSTMLDKIKTKIKDIQYSSINMGGIYGNNTLILTEDGKLYTMSTNKNMSGNNTIASNSEGDFTELTIKEGTTVKQILTEYGLSLALLSNGEVYGWGYNTYGILGPSYEVGGVYPTPVKLEGLPANIRYMSLGNGFAIFASKSGEVYGIGKNDYGQLGTGDSAGRTEFVRCTRLEE